MNEQVEESHSRSAALAAFRTERKLLLPVRRIIGDLQKKVVFFEARALSRRGSDPAVDGIETAEILRVVTETHQKIEALMEGEVGVGPAEDCRKALKQLAGGFVRL